MGLWFSIDHTTLEAHSNYTSGNGSYDRIRVQREERMQRGIVTLHSLLSKRPFQVKNEDSVMTVFWSSYKTHKIISFGKDEKLLTTDMAVSIFLMKNAPAIIK